MRQGDVVLIEFPYSDLSESKRRPALVLSNKKYNAHHNCILAGICGTKKPFSLPLSNADLTRKKLTKDSFVSLQNIFSADHSLIGKTVDSVSSEFLEKVLTEVGKCF